MIEEIKQISVEDQEVKLEKKLEDRTMNVLLTEEDTKGYEKIHQLAENSATIQSPCACVEYFAILPLPLDVVDRVSL